MSVKALYNNKSRKKITNLKDEPPPKSLFSSF
jgi:hypothetical protein